MLRFLKSLFGVLVLLFFFQSYGDFQIVEIFPNTTDDKNLEYIVIQNISQGALTLSGYTLSDAVKDYEILTGIELEPGEQQIFHRSETKLILNNSNETVFLRNIQAEIIDEVSYKKTVKGESLFFEVLVTIPQPIDSIISDEVIISQEAIIIENPDIPISEEIVPALVTPEILFGLQRPSDITQSGSSDTYSCDLDRDECRGNFDLRESFGDEYPERDYICQIDFGVNGVVFGQEERCNPNTITFPKGNFEVTFYIFHEDDINIFTQKRIFIENSPIEKIVSSGGGEESNTSILEESELQDIGVPDIRFTLQIPSYISESQEENRFYCDPDRDECRVNFDLRDSFGGEYPEKDYICQIDFGVSGVIFGQEEKCNPNTVTFPKGDFNISFKIYHKNYPHNFKIENIFIENTEQVGKSVSTASRSSQKISPIAPRISVGTSRFIVQSGLSGEGRDYYCLKDSCKINLKYEPKYKDEKCFWNFSNGEYKHPLTQHKCNPGFVDLPQGVHELSLKVYDTNYEENFIIFPFSVYPKQENISLLSPGDFQEDLELAEEAGLGVSSPEKLELSIQLQGKISQNKTLSGSTLTCTGVEKCSVNLLGIVQGQSKDLEYIWKLNGEIFSQKLNPAGIWVEGEGSHEISLQVGGIREVFQIKIYKDANLLSSKGDENQSGENLDKIDIGKSQKKIKFTQNFLALKYDGLRISGLAPAGSKIEIYHQGEKILTGSVDQTGKYRLVSKDFKAGEYIFDTKIILASGEEIFLERSGEFILKPEKRASWFIVKKAKTPKSSSSSSSTKVPPKLVVKENKIYILEEIEALGIRQKIIFVAGLLFLGIFMLLHMISKTPKVASSQLFSLYLERFSVKQKITLILP